MERKNPSKEGDVIKKTFDMPVKNTLLGSLFFFQFLHSFSNDLWWFNVIIEYPQLDNIAYLAY